MAVTLSARKAPNLPVMKASTVSKLANQENWLCWLECLKCYNSVHYALVELGIYCEDN